jgi:hypothetical protein
MNLLLENQDDFLYLNYKIELNLFGIDYLRIAAQDG